MERYKEVVEQLESEKWLLKDKCHDTSKYNAALKCVIDSLRNELEKATRCEIKGKCSGNPIDIDIDQSNKEIELGFE